MLRRVRELASNIALQVISGPLRGPTAPERGRLATGSTADQILVWE